MRPQRGKGVFCQLIEPDISRAYPKAGIDGPRCLKGHQKEGLIGLPSDFSLRNDDYFRTFTLKSAGGSNSDRDGSLNCTLVS
jgi:hypothetical protein